MADPEQRVRYITARERGSLGREFSVTQKPTEAEFGNIVATVILGGNNDPCSILVKADSYVGGKRVTLEDVMNFIEMSFHCANSPQARDVSHDSFLDLLSTAFPPRRPKKLSDLRY